MCKYTNNNVYTQVKKNYEAVNLIVDLFDKN